MNRLSITTAWNEASEILKRDFGALFTVALAFLLLPSLAMQALGPGQVAPGETPQPGLWMLLMPVVLVVNLAGSLAISSLALGRERVVGSAIRHGFGRVLPMLGAVLLVAVGAILVCLPIVMVSGIDLEQLLRANPAALRRASLVMLVLFVVAMFFGTRLLLMTPVAAAESGGPIAIIQRSWALTKGPFWKLLGFLLLLAAVALIIGLTARSIFGLAIAAVSGAIEPGSGANLFLLLLLGLLNAALTVVFTTLVARIYLQLAGGLPEAMAAEPKAPRPPATVRRDGDGTPG